MAADDWYNYTGGVVPPGVTRVRIDKSLTVIPARAFRWNRDIEEVECHFGVKTVKELAFDGCTSLRRVIMPGVEVVDRRAFDYCKALTYVECGKLERIGAEAFAWCKSLGSINLPSAKIVGVSAFNYCADLKNVKFGKELESIGRGALYSCTSLERITIPLKDNMITENDTFRGCENLKHVDLVEGAVLSDTIDALLLEEWKNEMKDNLDAINQSLPTARAGNCYVYNDEGEKAEAVHLWIRSVLSKIIHYKAQHHSLLNEAATALQQHALPQDNVMNNVLPFLELPSHTFEGEDTKRKRKMLQNDNTCVTSFYFAKTK